MYQVCKMKSVKRNPQTCRDNLSWWHLLDHQKHKFLIQMNIQLDCKLSLSMEPFLSTNEDSLLRPCISTWKLLEYVGEWSNPFPYIIEMVIFFQRIEIVASICTTNNECTTLASNCAMTISTSGQICTSNPLVKF